MKGKLITAALLAGTLALFGWTRPASAYHDGGVAYCTGCHTMHNSYESTLVWSGGAIGQAGPYLLKGSDQSSTCLNCHSGSTQSGYRVATYPIPADGSPPLQLGPGGDFAWVRKQYTWIPRGTSVYTSVDDRHGHNIVAADKSFVEDPQNSTSPGGTYDAGNLHCSSCHDPHGRFRIVDATGLISNGDDANTKPIAASGSYPGSNPTVTDAVGVYRLLGGIGYIPKSYVGGPAFTANPPAAIVPSTYNRSEAATQTRVAYGSGMSEWCGNCHSDFHNTANQGTPGALQHPADNGADLGVEIAANYAKYVKTGDLSGALATSYLSLISFEVGEDNSSAGRTAMSTLAVNDDTQLGGPEATDNVMCLSCHRAHASGWDSALRWNGKTEFITEEGVYAPASAPGVAQGRTEAEATKAYYERASTMWASEQRSLCNKCHIKD